MNNRKLPPSLLSTERVKELLTANDPDYGREFTEGEWAAITERLEQLARLIWRISERSAREERTDRPVKSRSLLPQGDRTVVPGMLGRK